MKDVSLDDLIAEDRKNHKLQRQNKPFTNKNQRLGHRGNSNGHTQNHNLRFDRTSNQNRRSFNKDDGKKWERDSQNFKGNQSHPNKTKRITHQRHDRPQSQPAQEKRPKQEDTPVFEKGRTLKILGLHPDITNEDLYKLFSAEGALDKCMIQQDNFGRNLPSAIVQYHTADAAKNAISTINGRKVLNSVLTVEPYKKVRN